MVYELCELKTPFDAGNIAALVLKIVNGSFAPLSESGYSNDLVELIRLCLTSAQAQRPTASELLDHSWFRTLRMEGGPDRWLRG